VRDQRDLKRKRTSSDPPSPSKELTALSYSSNDMRAAIKKLEKTTKSLSRFCEGELLTKIDRLERYILPIPYLFGAV
jgi:hypothetical protein